MKKLTALLLCIVVFGLSACQSKTQTPVSDSAAISQDTTTLEENDTTAPDEEISEPAQAEEETVSDAASGKESVPQPTNPDNTVGTQTPDHSTQVAPASTPSASSSSDKSNSSRPGASSSSSKPDTSSPSAPSTSGKPDASSTPSGGNTGASTPSAEQTDERHAVFELVNAERTKVGLSALKYREDLQAAADLRAKEIIQTFAHIRPDGSSCFTVLEEYGISYSMVGENIAYGYRNAEQVMNGWMNSEGHKANILKKEFTGIAVGLVEQNGTKYWVQIFIR